MLVHWIWYANLRGLSLLQKHKLMDRYMDPEEIFRRTDIEERLSPDALGALKDKDLSESRAILRRCSELRIQVVTYRDAAYPARLKNISDPPLVLYYKGHLPDFDGNPLIGVVGTRKASAYGLTVAKRMGYQIARCGGIVVSGGAFGIDGLAMQGALTAGMPVVGILGCGADIVYPVSNRALFQDVERYGCLLSEFPPGTPPFGRNFPKRNRIISGMSCGVLVVEAPEKSGALITAELAADQGRDVFAVPGNIDMDSFVGSNRLIRSGAIMVSHGWDILSEYQAQFPDKIRKMGDGDRMIAYPDEVQQEKTPLKVAQKPVVLEKKKVKKEKQEKIVIDKRETSPYSDVNDKLPQLSEPEQRIVDTLRSGERLVDDVIAETGLPAGKVLATLTLLEVKGVVKRLPGRHICLK